MEPSWHSARVADKRLTKDGHSPSEIQAGSVSADSYADKIGPARTVNGVLPRSDNSMEGLTRNNVYG